MKSPLFELNTAISHGELPRTAISTRNLTRMMGADRGGQRLRLDAIAVGRFHFALSLAWLMAYIVVASLPSELYEEPEPLELPSKPLEPLPSWLSDFPEPPYC